MITVLLFGVRQTKNVLSNLPGNIRVDSPPSKELATQSAVFAGLAVWALVQVTSLPSIAGLDVKCAQQQ